MIIMKFFEKIINAILLLFLMSLSDNFTFIILAYHEAILNLGYQKHQRFKIIKFK